MIICVSANPAIDRRLRLEKLNAGEVNRVLSAEPLPGGKAAHVAIAARALGEEVIWAGFLGGATGDECEQGLRALGINVKVVKIATETRTNLEIIESNGKITEILEPGGQVTERDVERLLSLCRDVFSEHKSVAPQVALSGSLPPGAPIDFYAELTHLAHAHNCRVLLDTSGEALRQGLAASPDLVKPNRHEAEMLIGKTVSTIPSIVDAANFIFEAGARSVAISLGADGIFWQACADCPPLIAQPPRVEVRSTVGCGDSALAGFAVAHLRQLGAEDVVRLAAACGTANCLAEMPGLISSREVESLARRASIRAVD